MKPIDGFQERDVDFDLWKKIVVEFESDYYLIDPDVYQRRSERMPNRIGAQI